MTEIHRIATIAVLLTACGGAPPAVPDPFVDRETRPLTEHAIEAIATLLRLEDHRSFDPAAFDRLAGSDDPAVRRRTVLAAGRIRDPDAVPIALRLLGDPSPEVRAEAAFALGQLGDTARVVIEALRAAAPVDWTPVREAETTVVVEVLAALGKLGSDDARAALVEALRRAHPAPGVHARRVAAEGLLAVWRFRTGAGRMLSAASYIGHPEPELRWRAAYALMRMNDPSGAARLVERLEAGDDDHRVRMHAARGLAAGRADSAGVRDRAAAALAVAMDDPHPHVRVNAIRSLAGYEPDEHRTGIAERLRDRDANVAIAAAAALAAMGPGSGPALAAFLDDRAAPFGARAAALAALAGLDPDAAYPTAERWAAGNFERRYAAARAMAGLGWERAGGLAARLAADPDPRVAIAALDVAAALATATAEHRPGIRELLVARASAEDGRVQTVARRGLATLDGETPPGATVRERPDDAAYYEDVVRGLVAPVLAGGRRPEARIETAAGRIVVELLADEAPLTVLNFIELARAGFYDQGVWHRVVPGFVLQDGAPAGDPTGGPGWTLRDEVNRHRYHRGAVGMAHSGPDTAGSQWFITHSDQPHLDGGYTVFGRVTGGMAAADRVVQGDPIRTVTITGAP